ncbi:uncharacterized protein LOC109714157 isoform X1 [Ananas comosus]|uniref:Uncharacterized protein LOC109714157 isoform X1 n=1 Tax=Ananas comosus TaxID=4615 RepID=A0A6P5FE41_ANACO|nr:uncharacterized protein LOC109714157 isoform X1 [Ananas comosus]
MAAAGAVAFSSLNPLPSLLLSAPSLRRLPLRRPFFRASSSSSSSPTEFNITFGAAAAPSKSLIPDPSPLDPWIVRDENGNLTLQSSPPARFLHAMAEAKASSSSSSKKTKQSESNKVKDKKGPSTQASAASTAPKYSKAARRFYNQNIREPQRLSKVLAAAGVASRRSSEELIFEGKVTVNGTVCTSPQTRVDLSKDSIYVNGNRLSKKLPPKLYFALNKPKGYICSCGEEPKSVVSLFDDFLKGWNKLHPGIPKPRLFTVGRLDVATTGLIIVTNDGEFAQRLSHPSNELSKEYIATVDGSVHKRHLIAISEGTVIEGTKCIPDLVELLPGQPDASRPRLRIVVHEGRNHEVRELVKYAGLQIYSLKRVRIGEFRLPSDLGLGKYVELKQADIKLLDANSQKIA